VAAAVTGGSLPRTCPEGFRGSHNIARALARNRIVTPKFAGRFCETPSPKHGVRHTPCKLGARSRLDKASKRSQSSTVSLPSPLNRNLFCLNPRLVLAVITSCTSMIAMSARGQELPSLINVVDYSKLLPLLPDAPPGWTADKPEGSTTDVGGFKLTNVHRDYRKGEGDKAPTTAISILDSAANPDYVEATTAAWNFTTTSTEGYSKAVTVDG